MDVRRAGVMFTVVVFVALASARVALASTATDTGGVQVTATPTKNLRDGDALAVTAVAPADVAIYQLSAHLCTPGPDVRTNFDFGFEGRRCANVALGHGDMEQTAEFGTGVQVARLPSFRVGEGAAQWVNELGYRQDIRCDAADPCDVVVRIQITDATVFDTIPVCFAARCSLPATGAGSDGAGAPMHATGGAAGPWAPGTVVPAAKPRRAAAAGSDVALGGHPSSPTGVEDQSDRVVIAVLAGVVGGAAAVWLVGRRRRTRSASTR